MAVTKKNTKKDVTQGKIFITATFNNTLVTITDRDGNTITWSSTGKVGFKGARKSTPFAATSAIEKAIGVAKDLGLREAEVFIKGPGPGRDASLRVLRGSGLRITQISDVTPVPHNGTRPKKARRG